MEMSSLDHLIHEGVEQRVIDALKAKQDITVMDHYFLVSPAGKSENSTLGKRVSIIEGVSGEYKYYLFLTSVHGRVLIGIEGYSNIFIPDIRNDTQLWKVVNWWLTGKHPTK